MRDRVDDELLSGGFLNQKEHAYDLGYLGACLTSSVPSLGARLAWVVWTWASCWLVWVGWFVCLGMDEPILKQSSTFFFYFTHTLFLSSHFIHWYACSHSLRAR